jgi:NAD(P)-dependent dehydrogenase (short-subunit alcohol dehydrogenase family)
MAFRDKRILIAGGSSGISLELTRALGTRDAHRFVDLKPALAEAVRDRCAP